MAYGTINILQTLPPRPLRPDERMLLNEWASAAADIATAYFSERRGDDPAMYRRIVIYENEDLDPLCLIHAPLEVDAWIKMNIRQASEAHCFNTLREALNSVRPVLQN